MNVNMKDIAKIIIDAFDVDIQLYMEKVLTKLRQTESGVEFAEWVENNPVVFESSLRVFSSAIQQLPRNGSILIETISDHLRRFPVELRRATLGRQNAGNGANITSDMLDDEFQKKYVEAIEKIPEEQLYIVAALSQSRLEKWVNSPDKIQPVLLIEWANKDHKLSKTLSDVGINIKTAGKNITNKIDDVIPEIDDPGLIKGIFLPIVKFLKSGKNRNK